MRNCDALSRELNAPRMSYKMQLCRFTRCASVMNLCSRVDAQPVQQTAQPAIREHMADMFHVKRFEDDRLYLETYVWA